MSREWKCKDCTVFRTDACIYPSQREEDKACNFVVVDADEAYRQGRVDGFNECRDNGYEVAFANGMKQGRADAIEEFAETLKSSAFIDIREYPTINEVADRLKEQNAR